MSGTDAVAALGEELDARPDLAPALHLYRELLAARAAWAGSGSPVDPGDAAARVAAGRPAIDVTAFETDWAAVRALATTVCEIAARHDDSRAERFRAVRAWLLAAEVGDLRRAAHEDLAGATEDAVRAFVLAHALEPPLRELAQRLTAVLETAPARSWCPACGGAPDVAGLEPDDGGRRLLCARCDTEWTWDRVGCPHCGHGGPEGLGYFSVGESAAYRLYVCDRCRGYLKTVDRREAWRRRPLSVERVLTLGLDLAAARAGYVATPDRR